MSARYRGLACLIIIPLLFFGIHCSKRDEGGEYTVNKKIALAIKNLDMENDQQVDSLVQEIKDQSLKNPRMLVELLHDGNEEDSRKAAMVILALGDLSTTPLLDSMNPDSPEEFVWDMQTVVSNQLANRNLIVKKLEEMLLDTRQLKLPEPPPHIEERPVPKRVCDEAYLMLRKILALDESEEVFFLNKRAFLEMSDEDRSAEIERARKTKKWISLMDQAADEGEF